MSIEKPNKFNDSIHQSFRQHGVGMTEGITRLVLRGVRSHATPIVELEENAKKYLTNLEKAFPSANGPKFKIKKV